jgi:hypothetical protein
MQKDKGRKNGDEDNGDEDNGDERKGEGKPGEGKPPSREREYAEPPPASRTKDESSHHSSPQPSDVQQAPEYMRPKIGQEREITGGPPRRVDVPMHVTKHPEPRGRPRQAKDDYE